MKKHRIQKNIFLESEGDSWYERNGKYLHKLKSEEDPIVASILKHRFKAKRILEIGCSSGKRLDFLQKAISADCFGIDPSDKAIKVGKDFFPQLNLQVGTAEDLPFGGGSFDLIIFGFCLYLCDREDLFSIATEADRVLADGGHVIIKDFHPPYPYKNRYGFKEGLFSYKMDYTKMFTWNPQYQIVFRQELSHGDTHTKPNNPDDQIEIAGIKKSKKTAYAFEPFSKKSI